MRRWIFILILLGWGNGNHEKLRGTATLEDVQPLANLLGIRPCQRNPFPRALIPGSGGRVVGRHVIEADASEHQKLDFPRDAADLELADIEIRKAAVVVLDLPSLHDVAELLGGRDVGALEQGSEIRDALPPLGEPERDVELDELL